MRISHFYDSSANGSMTNKQATSAQWLSIKAASFITRETCGTYPTVYRAVPPSYPQQSRTATRCPQRQYVNGDMRQEQENDWSQLTGLSGAEGCERVGTNFLVRLKLLASFSDSALSRYFSRLGRSSASSSLMCWASSDMSALSVGSKSGSSGLRDWNL